MVSFVVSESSTINIVIHAIVAIIIVPLTIHLLYKLLWTFHDNNNNNNNNNIGRRKMKSEMKILTCLFSIFFIPLLIANLFTEIYSDGSHPKQRLNWNLTMNVFYLLVNVCLYIIIIQRFKITFNDSHYASSHKLYIFLSFLVILYFLVYCSFFVIYAAQTHWFPASDAYKFYIFVDVNVVTIDLILTLIITYLFFTKLQRLIIDTYRMNNDRISNEIEIEEIEMSLSRKSVSLNANQNRMIVILTRLIILTLPAMFSSVLLWTISTWSWILTDTDSNAPILHKFTNILHAFLIPLDIVTNFLCIYLNFHFTKRLYRIICCGFDKCCLECCKCIIQCRIVKQEKRDYQLQTRYRQLSNI